MPRLLAALMLVAAISPVGAADATPAGFWKLTLPGQAQDVQLLLAFTKTDGKWIGDYGGSSLPLSKTEPRFGTLAIDGNHIAFTLKLGERDLVSYDGLLAADGKKISGSLIVLGGQPQVVEMLPTKLKKLDDSYAVALETLSQVPDGPGIFEIGIDLLRHASARKLPVEEVRGLVERLTRVAGDFGPRWERSVTTRLANALLGQEGLADVALAQARRAERMIGDTDDASTVIETLNLVSNALTKAGKADEAKPYVARIARLEAKDYQDYVKAYPPFAPEAYAGRKAMSDRAVLVEVLSGAGLPQSVATDLAADQVQRTYKPTEAIVLHYHLHLNGVDMLTSPLAVERLNDYVRKVRREEFPFAAVAGKPVQTGGGLLSDSEKHYKTLRKSIDEELEKPANVKLALTSEKGEKGYTLKAKVTDLANPAETMSLRFAIAEEKVRHRGANGLRYHHMIVRALPGGAKGFPLPKKDHEQTVNVDLDEVRKEIKNHLESVTQSEGDALPADAPLSLQGMKAIAFVVNDTTGDVLHAVHVDLDAK